MSDDGLLDLVSDAVIVFAADGTIGLWNASAARLYGLTCDQALGRNLHDLLGGHHLFGIDRLMETLAREGRWEGELSRTTAAGARLMVEVRWTRRPSGQIVETSRDLGQLSALEEETRQAAHRYRNIFQAMAASFWELDFSAVRGMIGALFASGVRDFRGHMRDHPDWVERALQSTRVVDVNEATLGLFGVAAREDLVGGDIAFAWPPESRGLFAEALVAAVERRDRLAAETVLTARDGRRIEALFTVCWPAEHQARGNVLVGVIDITARKQAETELRQSELRYRSLFQHMPIAMWQMKTGALRDTLARLRGEGVRDIHAHAAAHPGFLDWAMEELQVVEANDRAVEMLGAGDRQDLMGGFSRLWSNRAVLLDVMQARLGGAEAYTMEASIRRHDGRMIDVLTSVAFPEELSRQGFNQAGMIDITDRSLAKAALEQSEARYRTLFQAMPVGLAHLDMRGLITLCQALAGGGDPLARLESDPGFLDLALAGIAPLEVNAQCLRLFGARDRDEMLGPLGWMWQARPDTIRRALLARLRGARHFAEETRVNRRDGRPVDVLYTVNFSPDEMERGTDIVGFVDISDRIAAQSQLQALQTVFAHASRVSILGELTASIAHEVNQPLAAIAISGETALRWLSRPVPDLDEVRDLAGRIVADARRAAGIIARIRDMARNRAPEQLPLSVAGVVAEAMAFMEAELRHRAVSLHLTVAESLPPVLGDRIQIQQVIVNLVINAAQAMAEAGTPGPCIWISGAVIGPMVRITVRDNGPGLPGGAAERLFQGFVSTKSGGLGIGLSICRTIVDSHGGAIGGRSLPAGGACFDFTLRRAAPPGGTPAVVEKPARPG